MVAIGIIRFWFANLLVVEFYADVFGPEANLPVCYNFAKNIGLPLLRLERGLLTIGTKPVVPTLIYFDKPPLVLSGLSCVPLFSSLSSCFGLRRPTKV